MDDRPLRAAHRCYGAEGGRRRWPRWITHRGQHGKQISWQRVPFRPAGLYPGRAARTEIGKDGPADTAIASVIVMV
jgi:hypothetical protein